VTLTPDLNTLVEQSPMHYTFKNRSMPTASIPSNRLLRTLLAACSKRLRGEAREKSTSGGVLTLVRWSETIERNEAYGSFSAG